MTQQVQLSPEYKAEYSLISRPADYDVVWEWDIAIVPRPIDCYINNHDFIPRPTYVGNETSPSWSHSQTNMFGNETSPSWSHSQIYRLGMDNHPPWWVRWCNHCISGTCELSSRSSGPYSMAVLPAGSSSQGDTVHRQYTWEGKWSREREERERGEEEWRMEKRME